MPAPQLVQLDADAAEYVATTHDEHVDDDAAAKDPAAHIPVTADRPVVAQYDPAGQAEHELEPAVTKNVPVAQEVQTVDEVTEYLPTAHVPVTAESPLEAQYDPAEQALHDVDPVDA